MSLNDSAEFSDGLTILAIEPLEKLVFVAGLLLPIGPLVDLKRQQNADRDDDQLDRDSQPIALGERFAE